MNLAKHLQLERPIDWYPELHDSAAFEQFMALEGEIFRQVQGRKTIRFTHKGRRYFAKLHQGVGWREIIKNILQLRWAILGARAEWQAIQRLHQLGVATMELIAYGQAGINPAKQRSFIITAALENTVSLEDFCADWQKKAPSIQLRRRLVRELATIARRLHQHGINHRDFYLCHFLMALPLTPHPKLYLIDLHRAQIRRHTPQRWRDKDIAGLYFSALKIGLTTRDRWWFLKHYQAEFFSDLKQHSWLQKIDTLATKIYQKTYLKEHRSFNHLWRWEQAAETPELLALLKDPEDYFDDQACWLKQDTTTSVIKIELQQQSYILKRYNIKGFWHGLKRLLRPTRAQICWDNSLKLQRLDIATAQPIAMIEQRFGPLRGRGYFLSRYLEGTLASDYFTHQQDEAMVNAMCRLLKKLWGAKMTHGDLKASNLLITNGMPYLIDLDSMKSWCSARGFQRAQKKDYLRFLKNWQASSWLQQLFKQGLN